MIRIVLSSEHPFVRTSIRQMLSSEKDLEISGEAESVSETIQSCISLQPRILLLDSKYREDAAAINDTLKSICPQLGIIILAAFDQPSFILELLKAGVKGCLLCNGTCVDILSAIHTVSDGGVWISKSIFEAPQVDHLAQRVNELVPTQRETEVIRLLGEGLSNMQMAQQLSISERTIRFHLGNLMTKLKANNRTEVVIAAIRIGWIDPKNQQGFSLSKTTG